MFRPMKPETIARRAEQRRIETEARKANLQRRLAERSQLARERGEDDVWAELLAE